MMLHVTAHWILLIMAAALGMMQIVAWLRGRWRARQELAQRGWVCIDLPSPDSVGGELAWRGSRTTFRREMAAAAPAVSSCAVLLLAAWVYLACR